MNQYIHFFTQLAISQSPLPKNKSNILRLIRPVKYIKLKGESKEETEKKPLGGIVLTEYPLLAIVTVTLNYPGRL